LQGILNTPGVFRPGSFITGQKKNGNFTRWGGGIYQLNFIFGEQFATAVDVLHEEQRPLQWGHLLAEMG
jgi:hypothetical protein